MAMKSGMNFSGLSSIDDLSDPQATPSFSMYIAISQLINVPLFWYIACSLKPENGLGMSPTYTCIVLYHIDKKLNVVTCTSVPSVVA